MRKICRDLCYIYVNSVRVEITDIAEAKQCDLLPWDLVLSW